MDRGSLSKGRGTPRESPRARFAKSVWPGLYGRKSQAAKQLGTVSERSQYLSSLLSYYHIIQVVSLSLLRESTRARGQGVSTYRQVAPASPHPPFAEFAGLAWPSRFRFPGILWRATALRSNRAAMRGSSREGTEP